MVFQFTLLSVHEKKVNRTRFLASVGLRVMDYNKDNPTSVLDKT